MTPGMKACIILGGLTSVFVFGILADSKKTLLSRLGGWGQFGLMLAVFETIPALLAWALASKGVGFLFAQDKYEDNFWLIGCALLLVIIPLLLFAGEGILVGVLCPSLLGKLEKTRPWTHHPWLCAWGIGIATIILLQFVHLIFFSK